MTYAARLMRRVQQCPGHSAYQLSQALDLDASVCSSILKKLCDQGLLRRVAGEGPKGGFGYYRVVGYRTEKKA